MAVSICLRTLPTVIFTRYTPTKCWIFLFGRFTIFFLYECDDSFGIFYINTFETRTKFTLYALHSFSQYYFVIFRFINRSSGE